MLVHATSKSEGYKIVGNAAGTYTMQFISSANNAGDGKLYVQVIDVTGKSVCEYKDTIGSTGLIEGRWVHGGPP